MHILLNSQAFCRTREGSFSPHPPYQNYHNDKDCSLGRIKTLFYIKCSDYSTKLKKKKKKELCPHLECSELTRTQYRYLLVLLTWSPLSYHDGKRKNFGEIRHTRKFYFSIYLPKWPPSSEILIRERTWAQLQYFPSKIFNSPLWKTLELILFSQREIFPLYYWGVNAATPEKRISLETSHHQLRLLGCTGLELRLFLLEEVKSDFTLAIETILKLDWKKE